MKLDTDEQIDWPMRSSFDLSLRNLISSFIFFVKKITFLGFMTLLLQHLHALYSKHEYVRKPIYRQSKFTLK